MIRGIFGMVATLSLLSACTEGTQPSVKAKDIVFSVDPVAAAPGVLNLVQAGVKSRLRDPESARFSNVQAYRIETSNEFVCGYVNSKNGFGGYAGPARFSVWVDAGELTTVQLDHDDSLWAELECRNAERGVYVITPGQ